MDRYRLTLDNGKIFSSLFAETQLNFNGCTLREVIVTPEINLWQIQLITDKNFDEQTLHAAEKFLRQRYNVTAEIKPIQTCGTEPVPEKSVKVQRSGNRIQHSTSKDKMVGNVVKISGITEDSGDVIIVGEIGAGDMNGVNLREFKTGTTCVSFCVTDDTNGIVCKKFFKGDKKSDAQTFADTLKTGMLVKISAAPKYDDYAKEIVLFINALEPVEKIAARQDTAEVKRVELHVHTKMSAMDAVIRLGLECRGDNRPRSYSSLPERRADRRKTR